MKFSLITDLCVNTDPIAEQLCEDLYRDYI